MTDDDLMQCDNCNFLGVDLDFDTTDEPGERICPKCGSDQCTILGVAPSKDSGRHLYEHLCISPLNIGANSP